ncbi:MAG: hypothetical protein ABWY58_02250 [Aeromicrobium sp.]
MGSGDVTGIDVAGLNGAGRTVAGRSAGGQSAANGLKHDLDSASGSVGHARIKSALTNFVTNNVIDDSNVVGHQLTAAGDNVSNVASTARSSDEESAHAITTEVNATSGQADGLRTRINRIQ